MRTIAIGDVHGCFTLLTRLLSKIEIGYPTDDKLVFLGDLVDRGPDPVAVVHLVRELCAKGLAVCIRGNHEEKVIRWFQKEELQRTTGQKNRMQSPPPSRLQEWRQLSQDDREWFSSLPDYLEVIPGWYAVHAGFEARPMAEQKSDKVCRIRYVNALTGKMKSPDEKDIYSQPIESVEWMRCWTGPQNVVYGHATHSLGTPRVDRVGGGVETWGIDTGACYGGNLTALVLETKEVIQVSDGVKYSRWLGGK